MLLCLLMLTFTKPVVAEDENPGNFFYLTDMSSETDAELFLPAPFPMDTSNVSAIDPGDGLEGDCLSNITYTLDGSKIIVANSFSRNITVFDPVTMQIDTTVAVNGSPEELRCSDKYLVLLMTLDHSIQVYDLSDYSMVASFDVPGIPVNLRISEDNNYAYVGCYGTPEYMQRECKVIDLNSLICVKTFDDFPVRLRSIGGNLENNRTYYKYTQFEILPGGKHIAMGSGNSLILINTTTGEIDTSFPLEMCETVSLSGDGKYLLAWAKADPAKLTKVNLSTLKIESTVTITGFARSHSCIDIAVNYDGSKALVSTSANTAHMIRFDTGDCVKYDQSTTGAPSWISTTNDHSAAICGGFRTAVIDFESENVVGKYRGNWQQTGAVSPTENNFAGIFTPGVEKVQFYSFTDNSMEYRGSALAGSPVEGDGPRRAAISDDGSIAIIANATSSNISIMNMGTLEIDAIIDLGTKGIQNVAITSDSKWGVVCGYLADKVYIVDLKKRTLVASIATGTWVTTLALTPDDQHAYVANNWEGTVSVIKLDGAASTKIADISCPGQGYVPHINLVFSDITMSPDGSCCLVASPKDGIVRVIDTSTNKVVANIPVGDWPTRIAFNTDGSKAIVSNCKSNSCSLLNIDGASSSVIKTLHVGEYPIRVVYNSVEDVFAVALYTGKQIVTINPSSGEIVNKYNYPQFLVDLAFTEGGNRIALTQQTRLKPAELFMGEVHIPFYTPPCIIELVNSKNELIAVAPGPDMIFHVELDNTGITLNEISAVNLPGLSVSPNPGSDRFTFDVMLPQECAINLAVYDLNGRLVADVKEDSFAEGNYTFSWDTELPAGIYALKLDAGEKTVSRLFTVCR